MKHGRFSEEQIVAILKEAEAGTKAVELCRRHGISDATFYNCAISTAVRGIRAEAAAPARGQEPPAQDDCSRPGVRHQGTQRRNGKKRIRPAVKRQMVGDMMANHGLSERRACGLVEITRRSFRRSATPDRDAELRKRLRSLAEQRRRWRCPRLYRMLLRDGFSREPQTP